MQRIIQTRNGKVVFLLAKAERHGHVNGPELIVRYNYQIDDSNRRTLTFMLTRPLSRLA